MMSRMGEQLASELAFILTALCDSTLAMIRQDAQSYPEFRASLFQLIRNIIKHCTEGYFKLSENQFGTVFQTVLFAMEHVKFELMEMGLEAMHSLLAILSRFPPVATMFYRVFYTQILERTLNVLSDYQHMSGFYL